MSIMETAEEQGPLSESPTTDYNVQKDVLDLHHAIGFFGLNLHTFIDIITQRTNVQRQEILTTYKSTYAKDLQTIIKLKAHGNIKDLLLALLQQPAYFYAKELHKSLKFWNNEETLAEILCGLTNDEIKTIAELYNSKYNRRIESIVDTKVSKKLKRFFIFQLSANREEDSNSTEVDLCLAKDDAREIFQTVQDNINSDCCVFLKIFLGRSYSHIRHINDEYIKLTGQPLEKAVKKLYTGVAKRVFYGIVRYSVNKSEYFAGKLYESMNGLGTNNTQLIRLIVGRSENDLADIKMVFEKKYGRSLRSWIVGDTSGKFRLGLLSLIGEHQ